MSLVKILIVIFTLSNHIFANSIYIEEKDLPLNVLRAKESIYKDAFVNFMQYQLHLGNIKLEKAKTKNDKDEIEEARNWILFLLTDKSLEAFFEFVQATYCLEFKNTMCVRYVTEVGTSYDAEGNSMCRVYLDTSGKVVGKYNCSRYY